jgi:hypothetical protein
MGMTTPGMRRWASDFAAGLLDTPESDRIPLGATPDAYNGDFDRVDTKSLTATIKKRSGCRPLNPVPISAAKKVDGLFEFRRQGGFRHLMAVCNGALVQFDDVNAFTAVAGAGGFTAGNAGRACFFRNNAIVFDGSQNKRYDGTTVFDLGFAKPTSATNMTAVAPTGAGITGTFEAYYVWYDQTMDHESSPSDTTATTALVAQARHHTKPGGAPPTNVTHWRAYVRRTDTNEFNFFRAATVAVGTATFNEELSDTARRDAGAGPYSSDNDPPPGAFAILVVWKGFGIGVLANDDSYYVSRVGDLESWHPKNKFPVNRGDGENITSVLPFGTDILVHKGHQTYRLNGDALPFKLDPLHSRWGNVSQESGLEVDGKFYGWDRERGPYRHDTVNWDSLVDGRITQVLATVNRNALADIRAVYDEAAHVIRWAVPTTGVTRKRLVLKYHVGLDAWLPPDTGLEYGSFCTFTDANGLLGVYMGDYWGRVFQVASGDREGLPASAAGTAAVGPLAVTAATANTVTCGAAAFYTTGSGMAGLPVAALSPAGDWQWRRIASNTATQITLDTTNDSPWTTVPTAQYLIIVAGIRWYHTTPWIDFGIPELAKALQHFYFQGKATSPSHDATVHGRFNDDEGTITSASFSFPTGNVSGIWGTMIWGTGLWSSVQRRTRKARVERTVFSAQFQFSNYYADQPISVTAYGLTADAIPGRKALGYGE